LLRGEGYQTQSLCSNPVVTLANLGQGFDRDLALYESYEPLQLAWLARRLGLPATWVDKGAGEAVAALDRWLREERDPRRPFFLFVNLMEAHELYLPPRRQRRRFLPPGVGYFDATRAALRFDDARALRAQMRGFDADEPEATLRGLYAGGVAYQDEQLDRLLGSLRAHVDLDHTLLIVTAEHGENLGEGGAGGISSPSTNTCCGCPC
jgi:arylsulfatase A-like enzyme